MNAAKPRTVYYEYAALTAILILAVSLRVTRLDRGFWEDEAVEYVLGAARPFWGSFTYQPFPLYHVLAHIALYFSDEEWVIRVPSVLAGLGGIVALYAVARKFFGIAAAIVAGLLFAVSTFHISASTEARFYALTMLAAILVFWALHNALRNDTRRDWLWYVVLGNLAMMSQLMLLPLVGSMAGGAALWTLFRDRGEGTALVRPNLRRLVIASALCLIGVVFAGLAGGYNLARFLASDSTESGETVILDDLGNRIESVTSIRLTPGEYLEFFGDYIDGATGVAAWMLFGLALVGLISLARRDASAAWMVAAAIIIPPLPFFAITVTHFYHPRYFCAVLPFILFLIAGGLAGVSAAARRGVELLFERGARTTEDRAQRLAAIAASAVPFIVVGVYLAPDTGRTLNDMFRGDFSRGLHFEFEHNQTTQFIQASSAPTDYATMCFPRPDWRYYYRKDLVPALTAPAPPSEPFNLWYVGGMANCVNQSDLPTHARLAEVIPKEWLGRRNILRFEITAPFIRTLATESDFVAMNERSTGPPLQLPHYQQAAAAQVFEVIEDGQSTTFSANPVHALPHRYVEFIARLDGPPQFALAINYYDVTGRYLKQEVLRMREIQAQREPHPTGDTPPMAPAGDAYTIKLADTTPPLTAWANVEILVEGDTRAGDIYRIESATLRGNWAEDVDGADLGLPSFTSKHGAVHGWTVLPGRSDAGTPIEISDASEVSIQPMSSELRIESSKLPLESDIASLQFDMSFTGPLGLIDLSAVFFDARGDLLERVQLTAKPVYEWWSTRNMLIAPAEDGTSSLVATLRVPSDAAHVQFVFDGNKDGMADAIESGTGPLTLRSPRLHGFQ